MEREAPHRDRVGGGIAVEGVGEHVVTEIGEVDAHLVGAAGAEGGLHERRLAERLHRPERRAGRAAPIRRERRATCGGTGTADSSIDGRFRSKCPAHENEVAALDGVSAELSLQVLRGTMGQRQDHHAGSIAVESVHDVHAKMAASPPFDLRGGTG